VSAKTEGLRTSFLQRKSEWGGGGKEGAFKTTPILKGGKQISNMAARLTTRKTPTNPLKTSGPKTRRRARGEEGKRTGQSGGDWSSEKAVSQLKITRPSIRNTTLSKHWKVKEPDLGKLRKRLNDTKERFQRSERKAVKTVGAGDSKTEEEGSKRISDFYKTQAVHGKLTNERQV